MENFNLKYFCNSRTLYLIKGFGVGPVVALCVLEDAGGADLDAVAGELILQGRRCIFVLLDRQQSQGSGHEGEEQTLGLLNDNDGKSIPRCVIDCCLLKLR